MEREPSNRGSIPRKGKDFYILHIIQTISGIDPIPCSKCPGGEADGA